MTIVNYRCNVILNRASSLPIVMLHGYSFTSDVWRKIRVLHTLEEKGISFLALDMPYGRKSECHPKTRDPTKNVTLVKEAVHTIFGIDELILVGASLGGYIALKYAAAYKVRGLMVIAPVRSNENDLVESYDKHFQHHTWVIYGSNDRIVAFEELKLLVNRLPNSNLLVYEGAGHPAYLYDPERFNKDLFDFYSVIEKPID